MPAYFEELEEYFRVGNDWDQWDWKLGNCLGEYVVQKLPMAED
jgi:hypothetical protein